jgi:hypothetical protein
LQTSICRSPPPPLLFVVAPAVEGAHAALRWLAAGGASLSVPRVRRGRAARVAPHVPGALVGAFGRALAVTFAAVVVALILG